MWALEMKKDAGQAVTYADISSYLKTIERLRSLVGEWVVVPEASPPAAPGSFTVPHTAPGKVEVLNS